MKTPGTTASPREPVTDILGVNASKSPGGDGRWVIGRSFSILSISVTKVSRSANHNHQPYDRVVNNSNTVYIFSQIQIPLFAIFPRKHSATDYGHLDTSQNVQLYHLRHHPL